MRIASTHPSTVRLVQYPDGVLRLQGNFRWEEDGWIGFEWREIDTIEVDENGVEL